MRPVGLAIDAKGRLFFSSDATGEIYALVKSGGSSRSVVGKRDGKLLTMAMIFALYFVVY